MVTDILGAFRASFNRTGEVTTGYVSLKMLLQNIGGCFLVDMA
jgi:hypothetical protein